MFCYKKKSWFLLLDDTGSVWSSHQPGLHLHPFKKRAHQHLQPAPNSPRCIWYSLPAPGPRRLLWSVQNKQKMCGCVCDLPLWLGREYEEWVVTCCLLGQVFHLYLYKERPDWYELLTPYILYPGKVNHNFSIHHDILSLIQAIFLSCSIFMMISIAVERYTAVFYPFSRLNWE